MKLDVLINPYELNLILPFDPSIIEKESFKEINEVLLSILGFYLSHNNLFKNQLNHSLNIFLQNFSSIESNSFYEKVEVDQGKENELCIGSGIILQPMLI
jgi:hypothetical protein